MTKSCRQCRVNFEISDADMAFYEKVSPVFGRKKYRIPPPTLCPDCRHQQRWAFFNERSLYQSRCSRCQKDIISIYSPHQDLNVFCRACYFESDWDPLGYGREMDFFRLFFDQFGEMLGQVPHLNLIQKEGTENSAYCNFVGKAKDCYLTFTSGGQVADLMYCEYTESGTENSMDLTYCSASKYCYECVNCKESYCLFFSRDSLHCSESYFLKNCLSCTDCLACVNLQHKQYCIFNRQYTKEEYFRELEKLKEQWKSLSGLQEFRHKAEEFFRSHIVPSSSMKNVENTSGNYIYHSKDVKASFDIDYVENGAFCTDIYKGRDCYDMDSYGSQAELIYNCVNVGTRAYGLLFCSMCWNDCTDLLYCYACTSCQNCFGCVGLRNKQYCILNKQYTKEEYEELAPRIIEQMRKAGEWGEFFPSSLSPFGYNQTVAQEYYPLTREEVLDIEKHEPADSVETPRRGGASLQEGTNDTNHQNTVQTFNWSDYESPPPQVEKIITQEQMKRLPDDIKNIPDDILNWALTCEASGKLYRIVKQELKFYREYNIPIPRRHPDQRHLDRMALRTPRKLWERQCDCENPSHNHAVGDADRRHLRENASRCPMIFQTSYAPERPGKVYCEDCYLKETY